MSECAVKPYMTAGTFGVDATLLVEVSVRTEELVHRPVRNGQTGGRKDERRLVAGLTAVKPQAMDAGDGVGLVERRIYFFTVCNVLLYGENVIVKLEVDESCRLPFQVNNGKAVVDDLGSGYVFPGETDVS